MEIDSKILNDETNKSLISPKDIITFQRIKGIVETPSTIESMSLCNQYLAIGRQNGSIEIWDNEEWIQIIKIYGYKSKKDYNIYIQYKISIL